MKYLERMAPRQIRSARATEAWPQTSRQTLGLPAVSHHMTGLLLTLSTMSHSPSARRVMEALDHTITDNSGAAATAGKAEERPSSWRPRLAESEDSGSSGDEDGSASSVSDVGARLTFGDDRWKTVADVRALPICRSAAR